MIAALILVPALAGLVAFFTRGARVRRALLLATALAHSVLTSLAWIDRPAPWGRGALALDDLGLLFLAVTSAVFLAAALYAVGYLARERTGSRDDFEERFLFSNAPEAVFVGCLLVFLSTMTLVTVSQHFGLLWVAIEGTTLASAPLIYFHRHHRSLEATWKYLMVCSVGIGLALLGNFFLAVAAVSPGGGSIPLVVVDLVAGASRLNVPWTKASFLLLLVGYGTKMGLFPLHTWLPDAHSESPSVVSALLSGALLNCAFLGILRALQVCAAAGLGGFGRGVLTLFGLVSMALAAVFLLQQANYKRLLAYSSVEHMGILALGIGIGGLATYGALLHVINNALTKTALFLAAGNIHRAFNSKRLEDVTGALRRLPLSGGLFLAGFFAITGSPPFGPFISELMILVGAVDARHYAVAGAYVILLLIVFVGMGHTVLAVVQGAPPEDPESIGYRESPVKIVPIAASLAVVALMGIWIPQPLVNLLHEAARLLAS